jgi:histidinol-phosphate phosphatase family protein
MQTPSQAVILCGGLGMRLRPITNNLPKPMVIVNGKPFLHHLLEQLYKQGITRFLLLTGYKSEKIVDYFGDGSKFDYSISYSTGPEEWETGRRLWESRAKLDAQFLLLYSDNFVQFNLMRLKKLHNFLATPISLLIAPKIKGNIKISNDGRIKKYDKTRNGKDFNYVEVGYMIIERNKILKDFPEYLNFPNFSFSAVLEKFSSLQKIACLVVRDPYHSISDPERMILMSDYLRPKKIILIDRDGTINEKAPKGEYISNWNEFKWIPSTRNALIKLAEDGFKFIVITNQAGIARNMLEPDALEDIHQKMTEDLLSVGVEVLKVYVCPDHWEAKSLMRKPAAGMFFQAAKEFNLRMDNCLYIGDDESDCNAAANAGCGMVYLTGGENRPNLEEFPKPFFMTNNLEQALGHIKDTYQAWESRV